MKNKTWKKSLQHSYKQTKHSDLDKFYLPNTRILILKREKKKENKNLSFL